MFIRGCIFNRPFLKLATHVPHNSWISTVNNAKLWYLKPLNLYQIEKPYHINLPADALGTYAQSNEVSQEYAGIRIQDLRSSVKDFTLERNGFQVFQDVDCGSDLQRSVDPGGVSSPQDFHNDPDIVRRVYYPMVERLLKEKLRAQSAKAFTHDVRLAPYCSGK